MDSLERKRAKNDLFWDNFNDYVDYWRLNPHRFCTEYFGINLHFFQKVLIYMMNYPTVLSFMFWQQRGLGKQFLTMLFCVEYGTLYPGTHICVQAPTIRQSTLLIKKIHELIRFQPRIGWEIEEISEQKDMAKITLRSGQVIETVVCSDSARGERCNILILDEGRLMDKDTIQKSLIPLLTSQRTPPFMNNPKYRGWKRENNKQLFLQSIGTKDEWSYKQFQDYLGFMIKNSNEYFTISLPYQFGVESGVIDRKIIERQVKENLSDLNGFRMEMEVVPYGQSESAMFRFDDINKARKLFVPLQPCTDDEFIASNGVIYECPRYQGKQPEEMRIISMDIAVSSGRANDNTVFCVFRLMPNGEYYQKELSYMEVLNGVNLDPQILRLKQLFYDLECDYAVIDANGALGINAVDTCGQKTFDPIRNIWYPGWKTCNKIEKFDVRISDQNAQPVLYAIQYAGASASTTQYNMLVNAQLEFERGRIRILVHEDDAIEQLNKRWKYMKYKTSNNKYDREKADIMIGPFVNTSKLIEECINTQLVRLPSGRYTFDEGQGRKDRVMSMIYGINFINLLEKDLYLRQKQIDVQEYMRRQATTKHNNKGVNPFGDRFNKLRGFGARR